MDQLNRSLSLAHLLTRSPALSLTSLQVTGSLNQQINKSTNHQITKSQNEKGDPLSENHLFSKEKIFGLSNNNKLLSDDIVIITDVQCIVAILKICNTQFKRLVSMSFS